MMTPRIVVTIKLTAMTRTKPSMTGLLKKTPPDFRGCDVWMVDNAFKSPVPPSPKDCQMPEAGAAHRAVERKLLAHLHALEFGDDHLRDPITLLDVEEVTLDV